MSIQSSVMENVDFTVRRAGSEDREALLEMYSSFEPRGGMLGLPPQNNVEHWLDTLAAYPNFVVYVEDRLAGHGMICPDGDTAELAVFVHQDFRRQHIGKQLFTHMIYQAKQMGLRRVWGITEPDNLPMLRLACSFGFVRTDDPFEFSLDLQANPKSSAEAGEDDADSCHCSCQLE